MGDKLKMKARASQLDSSLLVPKTLWSGTDLTELLNLDLQVSWILKPIGSSGLTHFGCGPISQEVLAKISLEMPSSNIREQTDFYQEWAYGLAEDGYLLEERIGSGEIDDFKFFVFAGKVVLTQVDEGRFTNHKRAFFDREGRMIDLQVTFPTNREKVLPANYALMVKSAERLSANLDFIRVDLYSVGEEIYFGEFSPYSHSGLETFSPRNWDKRLGKLWQLPSA